MKVASDRFELALKKDRDRLAKILKNKKLTITSVGVSGITEITLDYEDEKR